MEGTSMAGYVFEHAGKQYTPEGAVQVPNTADHNRAVEARELARWAEQPDRMLGYYTIADAGDRDSRGLWHGWRTRVLGQPVTITTWLGTVIARGLVHGAYENNLGARIVCVVVKGTNGARYYGRAGFDSGTCVWLQKGKGRS